MKVFSNLNLFQNEIQNAVFQNLGTAPSSPKVGQSYFDTGTGRYRMYFSGGWQDLITSTTATNSFGVFSDGTTTASAATAGDTFRFRSASNAISVAVTNNDPTYGDNLLLTLNPANISLSSLGGLTADTLTQYALLAGRSTGQTLIGATTASGSLTLQSTSNVTKGKINFGTGGTAYYDESTGILASGTVSATLVSATTVTATGAVTGSNLSGTNSGDVTIGTSNGLSLSGQALSMALANGSSAGAMASADYTKLSGMTAGASVSSVQLAAPAEMFTVTGGPVTTSGTLTLAFANVAQNLVFASPNGATGAPHYRSLVSNDIPVAHREITVTSSAVGTAAVTVQRISSQTAPAYRLLDIDGTTQLFGVSPAGAITGSNFSGSSSGANTGDVTLGTTNGLSLSGQALSLALATGSGAGAMSTADYGKLNNSQTALSVFAAGSTTSAATFRTLDHTYISDFDTQVRTSRLDQMTAPTAAVSMNGQKLTNLGAPTAGSSDAATTSYVDAAVQTAALGFDLKDPVRVLSATNLPLSGLSTIDGITVVAGDRVGAIGQTTASQNGIYVAASGSWTRATDSDTSAKVTQGMFFAVTAGTVYGSSQWMLTTSNPITLNTTSLTFTQFNGGAQISAGNGLSKTGNTLTVVGTANRITVSGSGVDIASNYVGQTTITTLGTVGTGVWNGTAVAVPYGGTGATTAAGAKTNLGFITRYTTTIGDGTSTSITVTHNLNTQAVNVVLREISTPYELVYATVQATTVNTVTLLFGTAPTTGQFECNVFG